MPTTPASSGPTAHHEPRCAGSKRRAEPFLYLTGVSGTGKSSLLHAWLMPELAGGEPPTRTVVVRSYADPIAQLTDALTRPGVIWDKRPPAADDPRALLERAAEKVRPGRLLIAIDQFEECLILQDEAGRAQLAELFRSLASCARYPGLAFLLVLRDDYLDFDQLRRARPARGQQRPQLVQARRALARRRARGPRPAA